MTNPKFATAINCMDGRTQIPVIDWIKERYPVDYIDTITEPGPNKILAEAKDDHTIESLKKRVEISVHKHGSNLIVIVGHHDCAGNPVDKETQLKETLTAIETVDSWGLEVEIVGLWVDENWNVNEITQNPQSEHRNIYPKNKIQNEHTITEPEHNTA